MSELPVFEEGQALKFNGWIYEVTNVKHKPLREEDDDARVHEYEIEPLDGPPALLYPEYDGGTFTFQSFHEVRPEEITF